MMVAFRYDNDAVGSLYYSREIPSLFRGCDCRSCTAAKASSRSSRTACSCFARGNGVPRLVFPGLPRHSWLSGDVSRLPCRDRAKARARDEPRARDGRSAADGRRVFEPSAYGLMRTERYDIVIIGSGAGGGTMAYALADTSARILILERGDFVPQEEENWNPEAVWKHLRYQTKERWIDEQRPRVPPLHALQRRRQHEVLGQRAVPASARGLSTRSSTWTASRRRGRSTTTRSRPYYERAERLYHVHGEPGVDPTEPERGAFPHAPIPHSDGHGDDRRAVARAGAASLAAAARHSRRLHPLQHVQLVRLQGAREERGRGLLRAPGARRPNVEFWTNAYAQRLVTNASGDKVEAVEVESQGGDGARRVRRWSSCRAARSTPRRCCCDRRTTSTRTGSQTRRAWSVAGTWRISRR